MIHHAHILTLLLGLLALLASCGDDDNPVDPGPPPDNTAPTVTGIGPLDNATSVPITTQITASFSEPLDSGSVVDSVLTVSPIVSGSLSYSDSILSFTPALDLASLTRYTITIKPGLSDVAGNVMTDTVNWTFTTLPDQVPPTATFAVATDSAVLGEAAPVTVTASDNDGIKQVEFYVDGALILADSTAPYEQVWDTTGFVRGSSHTLFAVAYDNSGDSTSTDTLTVFSEWRLLREDLFDPTIPRDIRRVFARSTASDVQFRVEIHDTWTNYRSETEGIDVAFFIDIDQSNTSGVTANSSGTLNGIGADRRIIVGNHGDLVDTAVFNLWGNIWTVQDLVVAPNSNFFEFSLGLDRINNSPAFDLLLQGVHLPTGARDWVPDRNTGFITYTIDGSYISGP